MEFIWTLEENRTVKQKNIMNQWKHPNIVRTDTHVLIIRSILPPGYTETWCWTTLFKYSLSDVPKPLSF